MQSPRVCSCRPATAARRSHLDAQRQQAARRLLHLLVKLAVAEPHALVHRHHRVVVGERLHTGRCQQYTRGAWRQTQMSALRCMRQALDVRDQQA